MATKFPTSQQHIQLHKRDFLIIPLYIFFQIVLPIIVVFGTLGITAMITQRPVPLVLYNLSLSIGFLLAQVSTLYIFYKMHESTVMAIMITSLKRVSSHIKKLVVFVVITIILVVSYHWTLKLMQPTLDYQSTQYARRLDGLFNEPSALIITFIVMVILRPLTEQLIYRHILIFELGKVIPKWSVILLSIIIETLVHVYDMDSWLEILPFAFIAIVTTGLYVKTNYNLMVAYSFQVSIQLLWFIVLAVQNFIL